MGPVGAAAPAGRGAASQQLQVTTEQVLAAIESLYVDQLQPLGRILLKRLGERAVAARLGGAAFRELVRSGLPLGVVPHINKARLRRICERCRAIRVEVLEGGEYIASLADRRPNFVCASTTADVYPEAFWKALAATFEAPCPIDGRPWRLPGGRYASALALSSFQLPELAGRSLGELCHIVQLAICSRQLLGYCDGQVVPYGQSEAVRKQQLAALQQPTLDPSMLQGGKVLLPVASMEEARRCLRSILCDMPAGSAGVPLPNVKRLFRSRCGLELSETALGRPRLCELLQDACFRDICRLELQSNGYVVVPARPSPPSPRASASPAEAPLEDMPREVGVQPGAAAQWADEPPAAPAASGRAVVEDRRAPVARTFIHFAPAPLLAARPRARSLPKDHGGSKCRSAAPAPTPPTPPAARRKSPGRGRSGSWRSEASDAGSAAASLSTRTPSPSPPPSVLGASWTLLPAFWPEAGCCGPDAWLVPEPSGFGPLATAHLPVLFESDVYGTRPR